MELVSRLIYSCKKKLLKRLLFSEENIYIYMSLSDERLRNIEESFQVSCIYSLHLQVCKVGKLFNLFTAHHKRIACQVCKSFDLQPRQQSNKYFSRFFLHHLFSVVFMFFADFFIFHFSILVHYFIQNLYINFFFFFKFLQRGTFRKK